MVFSSFPVLYTFFLKIQKRKVVLCSTELARDSDHINDFTMNCEAVIHLCHLCLSYQSGFIVSCTTAKKEYKVTDKHLAMVPMLECLHSTYWLTLVNLFFKPAVEELVLYVHKSQDNLNAALEKSKARSMKIMEGKEEKARQERKARSIIERQQEKRRKRLELSLLAQTQTILDGRERKRGKINE